MITTLATKKNPRINIALRVKKGDARGDWKRWEKQIRPKKDVDAKVNHGNTRDNNKNIGDNSKSTSSAIHNVSSSLNFGAIGKKWS